MNKNRKYNILSRLLLVCFCSFLFNLYAYAQEINQKSESKITIDGKYYYLHTVKQGETLYSLGKTYDVAVSDMLKANPQAIEGLRSDHILKIPVMSGDEHKQEKLTKREQKKYVIHTVSKGETAYSISKQYQISIDDIILNNPGLDPSVLVIGQQIKINKKRIDTADDQEIIQQWSEVVEKISDQDNEFTHHVVKPKETLYSLSKQYEQPVEVIEKYNTELLKDGLKEGSVIKIPVKGLVEQREKEEVKPEENKAEVFTGVKQINRSSVNVSLILPFSGSEHSSSFVEFYNGALLALEDLKSSGASVNLNIFNSNRSAGKIYEILSSPKLAESDLIIGPVYEEGMSSLLNFAGEHRIPLVSPLSPFSLKSPYLIEAAPPAGCKTAKMKTVLQGDKNIIIINPQSDLDADFAKEIRSVLPSRAHEVTYSRTMNMSALAIDKDKENIIIIPAKSEKGLSNILERLCSLKERDPRLNIRLIGNARWIASNEIDHNLLFRLNFTFITNYYIDKTDSAFSGFNSRYVTAFSALPSLYSFRGYDVFYIFINNLVNNGSNILSNLNGEVISPLAVKYEFKQNPEYMKYENINWILVKYNSDYIINVE